MSETVIKPLLYGVDFDAQTRVLTFKRKDGAEIYSCIIPESGLVDDVTKPLMLRAIVDNSSVTLNAVGSYAGTFKTSTDAETWESYVLGTEIPLNADDCVYFKVDNFVTKTASAHCQFAMTGTIEAWNNVNSMVSLNFASLTDLSSFGDFTFCNLLRGCSSLVKAPLLPATTLANSCYSSMLYGCTGLTQSPELPATTLTNGCYFYMLSGCTSLAQAPALPATTLAQQCYQGMFYGCTSLTQAPALSATTLESECYKNMFNGCTSLTQAPALPATTLVLRCYENMFNGCTGLTQAPALSATTLANFCCLYMFSGCTGLTESPVLNAPSLGASYAYKGMFYRCSNLCKVTDHSSGGVFNTTDDWLYGVAATGEFHCPSGAKWSVTGASGIPANWSRIDI